MPLSATNTVDKQDVQLRKEDESQWVASGVVWWSAVTAQLQGSGFVSAYDDFRREWRGGIQDYSAMFITVETLCHSKSIGIEAALADQC